MRIIGVAFVATSAAVWKLLDQGPGYTGILGSREGRILLLQGVKETKILNTKEALRFKTRTVKTVCAECILVYNRVKAIMDASAKHNWDFPSLSLSYMSQLVGNVFLL